MQVVGQETAVQERLKTIASVIEATLGTNEFICVVVADTSAIPYKTPGKPMSVADVAISATIGSISADASEHRQMVHRFSMLLNMIDGNPDLMLKLAHLLADFAEQHFTPTEFNA